MVISVIKDFEKELPKFESQIKGNDELFSENEDPAVTKRIDWIKMASNHFGKSPLRIIRSGYFILIIDFCKFHIFHECLAI